MFQEVYQCFLEFLYQSGTDNVISYGSMAYALANYTINYENCNRFYSVAMCTRKGYFCFVYNVKDHNDTVKQLMNFAEIIWVKCILFTETINHQEHNVGEVLI